MRTVAWQGLTLDIEREPGAVKRLCDGREVVQVYPYGSIAGTQGVDEEAVDVLLGPTLTAPWVYVVHQHIDGEHDEDKALIGWQSADDARRAYERQYTPEMFGGMTVLSVSDFVARLANRKRRPGKVAFGAMGATTMANWQRQAADARGEKWAAEEKITTNSRHRSEQFFLITMFVVKAADGRCAWRTTSTSVALRNEPMQGEASSLSDAQRAAESAAEQMIERYRRWAESDKARFPGDVQIRRGMSVRHAFTVSAFSFAADMGPTAGPWHQVAKFGSYVKDGATSEFTTATLGQIVDNFARRQNLLSMDAEHQALNAPMNGQPAPPLAYYDALALVEGGKVTKFAARGDVPQPGGLGDGLWAHRARVTPYGEKILESYMYISPAFVVDGTDEQGNPIGYDLLNIAATSIPFLDGMEPMTFYALPGERREGVTQMAALDDRGAEYITLPSGGMVRPLLDPVEVDGRPAIIVGLEPGRPDMAQVQFQGERGRDAYPLARIRKVGMSAGSGAMKMATQTKQGAAITAGDRVWANGTWHVVASVEDDALTGKKVLRFQDGGGAMVGASENVQVSMSAAPGAAPRTGFAQRMASAADEAAVDRAWEEYQRATNAARGSQDPEAHKRQAELADKFADVAARAGYEQDAAAARSDAQRARELAARVDDLRKNPVVLKPGVIGPYMSAAPVGGTNGGSMNPDLMRRMGFADGGQPTVAEKCARYGAHCMGAATPDEITAMAADLEAHAEPEAKAMAAKMRRFAEAIAPHAEPDGDEPIIMDVDPSNLAQNAAVHLKTGNVHDEGGRKHSRMSQAFATLAGRLGLDPRKTSRHAVLMAATAGMVPIAEIGPMVDAQVAARLEADRRAAEARAAEQAAASLAEQAIAGGYPHGQREALVAFARTNAAAARTLVAPYLAGDAALMTRTSRGGTPAGAAVPTRMSAADDVQIVQRGTVQIARTGNALAREARAYRASTGASYEEALEHLRKTRPDLIAANFNG